MGNFTSDDGGEKGEAESKNSQGHEGKCLVVLVFDQARFESNCEKMFRNSMLRLW